MLKIGVGSEGDLEKNNRIDVNLYGSLSLTGAGHATDIAVVMGLRGFDPTVYPMENIPGDMEEIRNSKKLTLAGGHQIDFVWEENICFNRNFLNFHPNGMSFSAFMDEEVITETYYSIGGGFVVQVERDKLPKRGNHSLLQASINY
jgi:L-serine dehydratase